MQHTPVRIRHSGETCIKGVACASACMHSSGAPRATQHLASMLSSSAAAACPFMAGGRWASVAACRCCRPATGSSGASTLAAALNSTRVGGFCAAACSACAAAAACGPFPAALLCRSPHAQSHHTSITAAPLMQCNSSMHGSMHARAWDQQSPVARRQTQQAAQGRPPRPAQSRSVQGARCLATCQPSLQPAASPHA